MGLDATVDRNPKHLPDHLRERVIVDSASGVMDLRDPADDRIFGKAKREAWQKTTAARSRDRKSTRLNSSHQIISYAVFCLKKKKKKKNSKGHTILKHTSTAY